MPEHTNRLYFEKAATLKDPVFDARLKLAIRNCDVGQRDLLTEIQDLLLKFDGEGMDLWTPAELVPTPLIDDEFEHERWVREFLENPPGKDPHKVRWLALYIREKYPRVYRHLLR